MSLGRQQAAMKKRRIKMEVGSGNIFADLGLPNAEEHLLKASLVVQLHRFIKARKLTQVAAAKLIGVKQPDLSNILRGHYQRLFTGTSDAHAHGVRSRYRNHRAAPPPEIEGSRAHHVQSRGGVTAVDGNKLTIKFDNTNGLKE